MSTHSVQIIEIETVLPHDNAERLEIVPVGGWQAVVKKGQFKPGDRAVYVQPDYVVPTALEEFAFLHNPKYDAHRLKAVRLRGVLSFGLLIPVPERLSDRATGSCVMEDLGITRYEAPIKNFRVGSGGDAQELAAEDAPTVYAPKFDLENIQNFKSVFMPGELVIVTEKIHGANARYLYHDGKFFVGSRTRWLKPDSDNIWTRAFTSQMQEWLMAHPDVTLFGEIFGPVQSLKYGYTEPTFAAFAALSGDNWIDQADLFDSLDDAAVVRSPVVYRGQFDFDVIAKLAETDSYISATKQMMEGVVIVPLHERRHPSVGRVALKYISNRYWESNE